MLSKKKLVLRMLIETKRLGVLNCLFDEMFS